MEFSRSKPPEGELTRPTYQGDGLLDTVGYVRAIWVECEGDRDRIHFTLAVFRKNEPESTRHAFIILLDTATTVALAQLQLLRDAARSVWDTGIEDALLVRVHFSWTSSEHTEGYVYWLKVMTEYSFNTTVDAFYEDHHLTTWYTRYYDD